MVRIRARGRVEYNDIKRCVHMVRIRIRIKVIYKDII